MQHKQPCISDGEPTPPGGTPIGPSTTDAHGFTTFHNKKYMLVEQVVRKTEARMTLCLPADGALVLSVPCLGVPQVIAKQRHVEAKQGGATTSTPKHT